MAERSVPQDKKYIDPLFALPEGVAGYEYAEHTNTTVNDAGEPAVEADEVDIQDNSDLGVEPDSYVGVQLSDLDDNSGAPSAPNELTILSQNAHFATTGQQIVDVVVDVPEERNVMRYEFRVTKIQ